jgi:glucan phosphoethanolaminetransferase (alkaline phosphatase superfamily)
VLNVHDVSMAFDNVKYWPSMTAAFLDWRGVPPILLAAVALLLPATTAARWRRAWIVAIAATIAIHATLGISEYARRDLEAGDQGLVAPPMTVFQSFARTLTLLACDDIAARVQPTRRATLAYTAPAAPTRNVMLVIDESMSADHLSLNGYTRQTTPWLASLSAGGVVATWGDAAAASTYSDASVISLLTGFDDFPDGQHAIFTWPTLFQYAKAMRYETHLLDGESTARRYGLDWRDLAFVDDWRSTSTFSDDADTDVRMAKAAASLVAAHAGQFIVILKRGNHEPPEGNYPAGTGAWSPSRDRSVPAGEELTAIANSYDNAIRYNLDAFFHALLSSDGRLPHTAGLYTSDHAEALGGDGGAPFIRRMSKEVLTVPLVAFGDDFPRADTGYRASHRNVFATILDLMGVPVDARVQAYGRSLLAAHAADHDLRPVLSGYMFGPQFWFEVRAYDDFSRVLASAGRAPQRH